jgi:hypothetical protein
VGSSAARNGRRDLDKCAGLLRQHQATLGLGGRAAHPSFRSRKPITVCASTASMVESSENLIQGPNIQPLTALVLGHSSVLGRANAPRDEPGAFPSAFS